MYEFKMPRPIPEHSMVWKGDVSQCTPLQYIDAKSSEGEAVESPVVQSTTDDDWRSGRSIRSLRFAHSLAGLKAEKAHDVRRVIFCIHIKRNVPLFYNLENLQCFPVWPIPSDNPNHLCSGDFFPLMKLPKEMIILILHMLPTADRFRARVCKALYDVNNYIESVRVRIRSAQSENHSFPYVHYLPREQILKNSEMLNFWLCRLWRIFDCADCDNFHKWTGSHRNEK